MQHRDDGHGPLIADDIALDHEGRFETRAVLADATELDIEVEEMGATIGEVRASAADLLSPSGANLEPHIARLKFHAIDEKGAPVAGAAIWAEASPRDRVAPRFTSNRADGSYVAQCMPTGTDIGGRAELRMLASSAWEIVAACKERLPCVKRADAMAADSEIELVMPLADVAAPSISGTVTFNNEPVVRAQILISGEMRLSTFGAPAATHARGETDQHGKFTIPYPHSFPVSLSAVGGTSPEPHTSADGATQIHARALLRGVMPGSGSIELRMVPEHWLRFDVTTEGIGSRLQSGGSVQCVAFNRATREIRSSESYWLPGAILAGSGVYDVYVSLPSCNGFGRTNFELTRENDGEVAVVVRPARWIEGRVLDAKGAPVAGVRVIALASWPSEVAEILGSDVTDARGAFRVLTSDANAELVVRRDANELARAKCRVGAPVELRLP